jgi:predicted permease
MFLSLLNDGGPVFMYPLLIILILVLILIVKGILKKGNMLKTISLISSVALFAIVWGFLGQIIGLIDAFDTIEEVGDVSPAVLAGGLKVSFLAPVFGLIIFLVGRLGIIVLTWMQKEDMA